MQAKVEAERLNQQIADKMKGVEGTVAEAVRRVSETTLLKAQFENFLEKQAKFE